MGHCGMNGGHQRRALPPSCVEGGKGLQNVVADTIHPGDCHASVRAGSQ